MTWPVRHRTPLAVRDDHRPGDPLDQTGRTASARRIGGRVGVVALHQQHTARQGRLALPEADQRVQFRGRGGDQVGRDRGHPQSDRRTPPRRRPLDGRPDPGRTTG